MKKLTKNSQVPKCVQKPTSRPAYRPKPQVQFTLQSFLWDPAGVGPQLNWALSGFSPSPSCASHSSLASTESPAENGW